MVYREEIHIENSHVFLEASYVDEAGRQITVSRVRFPDTSEFWRDLPAVRRTLKRICQQQIEDHNL